MFGNHPTKVQVISKTCRRALLSTAQPIVWGRVQPFQIDGCVFVCLAFPTTSKTYSGQRGIERKWTMRSLLLSIQMAISCAEDMSDGIIHDLGSSSGEIERTPINHNHDLGLDSYREGTKS